MLTSASSSRLRGCTRTLACSPQWHPKCDRSMSSGVATRSTAPRADDTVHQPFFPKGTRSQLFSANLDTKFRGSGSGARQAARFKMQLAACADEGHAARAFRICAQMKQAGIKPDLTAYNWLLHACAKSGLGAECLALFEDMAALNLKPDHETYNHIIYAERWNKSFPLADLLDRMKGDGLNPNMHTYHHIIMRHVEMHNLEMCLECFAEMNQRSVSPTLKTTQAVIELATFLGHARLALDLAHAFESTSVRKLEAADWMRIMAASTACHYKTGIIDTWSKAVDVLGVIPDEGQCIETLNTAGRYGLTDLAVSALQTIMGLGVPLEEFHLAPVLEAFSRGEMLEEAFAVINLMRSSGVQFTEDTASVLMSTISQNIDQVDEAWSLLDKMHQQKKPVDVVSLNLVIEAALRFHDLQRAIGIYKAFPDFNTKPTISTYNCLFAGCVVARNRELGDQLLVELREHGLAPDSQTFELMIGICLTQSTYEDAFFYLEEMKGQGYMPPFSVYSALVKKCVSNGDTRWKIALDEMKERGHTVTPGLQLFIDTGGQGSLLGIEENGDRRVQ